MIRRLDATTDTFLTDLADVHRRLDRAQREVSSGRRINQVSDGPDEISNLLQIRTELKQTEQIRQNLSRVRTEVDSAEQSLQAAVRVIERARVLGARGATGTLSADERSILAQEVESLLVQMVGLSKTRAEARFVFSGNADGQPPYDFDLSLDDPVGDYQGSAANRQVLHPSGTTFEVARTAEEIFDNADPAKNVFQAINNLRLALRDDDQAAIEAALAQLETADTHMNNELAWYGSAQNQVAEATDFAYGQELRLKTRIGEIEDADMVESILALNQARYQVEVALNSQSQIKKTSLFDYLG